MKRFKYKFFGECLVFSLVFAILLTFFAACSKDVAGGSSEDAGFLALINKKISGAVQKGPFVTGSSVVLRETSAAGNLEPTGREFETTVVNDEGKFKFGDLDLECQYVLLSAEGYYTRESDGSRSECPVRLDAATNLNKRNTANINLLTHFEYKRVLKLVEEGKTFAEAKKQASREVLGAFGVEIEVSSAEDLDIFNTSEGDRILYIISQYVDNSIWEPWDGEGGDSAFWAYLYGEDSDNRNIDCSRLQAFIDGFADDYADDGVLSDTIMQWLASDAYFDIREYRRLEGFDYETWEKDEYSLEAYEKFNDRKQRYEFGKSLFLNYMGLEMCTEDLLGEYREFYKPIKGLDTTDYSRVLRDGYFLCDGSIWKLTTKGYLDSLKMKIDHESGMMTDPRDGRTYKTVGFEFNGIKYEWMAEDLKYKSSSGLYSWTTALQIDKKYMKKAVEEGVVGSKHQGICPDGWHVSNDLEWRALVGYVGDYHNLFTGRWDGFGMLYNRFDFNLELPKGEKEIIEYHTYPAVYVAQDVSEDIEFWMSVYEDSHDEELLEMVESLRENGRHGYANVFFAVAYNWGSYISNEPQKSGRIRCVKD